VCVCVCVCVVVCVCVCFCVGEFVEFLRGCVCDVLGRVGGIVKMMFV